MQGIFAAIATPVDRDGRPDLDAFDRLLTSLARSGVDGVCLGGATSEYPHFETAERIALVERAAQTLPPGTPLLVGVGAPMLRRILEVGQAAMEAGSRALLLPMPMFFRYGQDDLREFCAQTSRALRAPCLLYDLPDFTNGLAPETSMALLRDEEFIVGIKDSSGREPQIEQFARARGGAPWVLFVGDDRLLARGLRAGWNGGISGVAGFCPELVVAFARSVMDKRDEEAARLQALLDELLARLGVFPTPWAIRLGLAARGVNTGSLPLPLTSARRVQAEQFQKWLPEWLQASGFSRDLR
jgi:4-hydroxy-tetrahydrodipicolinate synthase